MKIDYQENVYTLVFKIKHAEKYININFFKLLLDVNNNIIDNKIITDKNIFLLLKHFYKDLGIKQQYLNVNITHDIEKHSFYITTIKDLPFNVPSNTEMLDLSISIEYKKETDVSYLFCVKIKNNSEINIEDFNLEKLIGKIIIKIFNNLKEYIEGNIC